MFKGVKEKNKQKNLSKKIGRISKKNKAIFIYQKEQKIPAIFPLFSQILIEFYFFEKIEKLFFV